MGRGEKLWKNVINLPSSSTKKGEQNKTKTKQDIGYNQNLVGIQIVVFPFQPVTGRN